MKKNIILTTFLCSSLLMPNISLTAEQPATSASLANRIRQALNTGYSYLPSFTVQSWPTSFSNRLKFDRKYAYLALVAGLGLTANYLITKKKPIDKPGNQLDGLVDPDTTTLTLDSPEFIKNIALFNKLFSARHGYISAIEQAERSGKLTGPKPTKHIELFKQYIDPILRKHYIQLKPEKWLEIAEEVQKINHESVVGNLQNLWEIIDIITSSESHNSIHKSLKKSLNDAYNQAFNAMWTSSKK